MQWYALNKKYVNYLKQYDKLVPNIEYTGRLKCFLGIVLKTNNNYDYFAPLTSYKPKFQTMNNDIDFFKLVLLQFIKIMIYFNKLIDVLYQSLRKKL